MEADAGGDVTFPVGEHGLDFGMPPDHVQVVLRQVDNGTRLADDLVHRIGLVDRLVAERVDVEVGNLRGEGFHVSGPSCGCGVASNLRRIG